MMQPCASAAKLRSGGPILFFGMRAMEIVGTRHLEPSSATRHKRTDSAKPVGGLQQPRFIAPGAERHLLAPRPLSQTATGRSEAPRPLSWSCDCRGRSRCGLETTAPELLVDGFTIGQLTDLVLDGFAKMQPTVTPLSEPEKIVVWLQITAAGRKAIAQ
jgi:hypothetical protein